MSKIAGLSTLILALNISLSAQINPYQAPLYWSVYEHHIVKEYDGLTDNYFPEAELMKNIQWVDQNLKEYGYDMVCMDGWGDVSQLNLHGYRASHSLHWEHDFAWWSDTLQALGMTLGMYGNPLWIHVASTDSQSLIIGTDIPVSSLIDPDENALWFTWVQVDRPGAEDYIKGYVQYYADMGIKYFRVDFLSWYETGYDHWMGTVGHNRPRAHYETALRWMREACDENGMFLSLVMPNLFNEAELEKQYGHMIRINADAGIGTWHRFSDLYRGERFGEWSQYENTMDGFTYWSYLAGRNNIILDGDFIRINTFGSDSEKRAVISAHILAGGPVSISDQYNTIESDLWLYQNEEILALNHDGFVGNPLSNDPTVEDSQTWTGQMSNGDWVIGFFNRELLTQKRSLHLNELGFSGQAVVRDLWQHADLGYLDSISIDIPPRSCIILKLQEGDSTRVEQDIIFNIIPDRVYGDLDFRLEAITSSGLPVEYEIASGPAEVSGDQLHLTGTSGIVYVVASQAGDDSYYAAIPQVQSFELSGGHHSEMYLAGDFTSWNLSVEMRLDGDTWVAEAIALQTGDHQMKFANTQDWSGNDWGNSTGLVGIVELTTGGAPNTSFIIPESDMYDIYFNDIDLSYSIEQTLVNNELLSHPQEYVLSQNYPNPFNPITSIRYEIPEISNVLLRVYDITGKEVQTLINNSQQAGRYTVQWTGTRQDGSPVGTGVYLARIEAGGYSEVIKMVYLR